MASGFLWGALAVGRLLACSETAVVVSVRSVVVVVVVIVSWPVVVVTVEVSGLTSVVRPSVVVVESAVVVIVVESAVVVIVIIHILTIVIVVVMPIVRVVVVEERPGLAVFDLVRELQTGLGLGVGRRAGAKTDHADCFGGLAQVRLQQAG